MRGGVVLDLFLSSLPAFPYFSPPLPVLHDASARVSIIAVTIGQKKRFFTIYPPLSRVRVCAHIREFALFAFTTFTEILAIDSN